MTKSDKQFLQALSANIQPGVDHIALTDAQFKKLQKLCQQLIAQGDCSQATLEAMQRLELVA